jgi:hypothetical protein
MTGLSANVRELTRETSACASPVYVFATSIIRATPTMLNTRVRL